jgi:D-3-phosphoglycerate dehydrogenase
MVNKKVLLIYNLDRDSREKLEKKGFELFYRPDLAPLEARADLLVYLKNNKINVIIGRIPPTDKHVMQAAGSSLEAIICTGKGLDHIELNEAKKRNIKVVNTDVNSIPVAEMALGLMLSEAKKINLADSNLKRKISASSNEYKGTELHGKTLAIIGTGGIGLQLGIRAKSFFGKVLTWNRSHTRSELARREGLEVIKTPESEENTTWSKKLSSLLNKADYVSINTSLNDETRGMVDADFIAEMKQGAKLINVSRVELLNVDHVVSALNSGTLSGLLVDGVISPNSPLYGRKDVIITPHIADNTAENDARTCAHVVDVASNLYKNILISDNYQPLQLVSHTNVLSKHNVGESKVSI